MKRRHLHSARICASIALPRLRGTGAIASADTAGGLTVCDASTLGPIWRRTDLGRGLIHLAATRGLGGDDALVAAGPDGRLRFLRAHDGELLGSTEPGEEISALCEIDASSFALSRVDGVYELWAPPYDRPRCSKRFDTQTRSIGSGCGRIAIALCGTVAVLSRDLVEETRLAISDLGVRILEVSDRGILVRNGERVSEWSIAGAHVRDWEVRATREWSRLDADHWAIVADIRGAQSVGIVGQRGQWLHRRPLTASPIATVTTMGGVIFAGTWFGDLISYSMLDQDWLEDLRMRTSDFCARTRRRLERVVSPHRST